MTDFECDFCSVEYACKSCHCCKTHCGCEQPKLKKHTNKCTQCNKFIKVGQKLCAGCTENNFEPA